MPFLVGLGTEDEIFSRLKHFLTGSAEVVNVSFAGTGNGTLINPEVADANRVAGDYYEIDFVASETYGGTFRVTQFDRDGGTVATSGGIEVNVPFLFNGLSGYVDFGSTDFAVSDKFTVRSCDTSLAIGSPKPVFDPAQLKTFPATPSGTVILTCSLASQSAPYVEGEFTISGTAGITGTVTQGTLFQDPLFEVFINDPDGENDPLQEFALGETFTFYLTEGVMTTAGAEWEILSDNNVNFTSDDVMLKGQGDSGLESIYCYVGRRESVGNYAWWRLSYATGYNDALTPDNQPNFISGNLPIMQFNYKTSPRSAYYIIASASEFKVNYYAPDADKWFASTLGYCLPYSTPQKYPYPIICGGSSLEGDEDYDLTSDERSNYWFPIDPGQLVVLDREANDVRIFNYGSYSAANSPVDSNSYKINVTWPWGNISVRELRANLDGSWPAIRGIIGPRVGEFRGVFAVQGYSEDATVDGILPLSIIYDTVSGRKLVVFPNQGATDNNQFCAMELA